MVGAHCCSYPPRRRSLASMCLRVLFGPIVASPTLINHSSLMRKIEPSVSFTAHLWRLKGLQTTLSIIEQSCHASTRRGRQSRLCCSWTQSKLGLADASAASSLAPSPKLASFHFDSSEQAALLCCSVPCAESEVTCI